MTSALPTPPPTRKGQRNSHWKAIVSAVILTASLLVVVQIVVERPMLMAERLLPGTGWIEIAILSCYAGFLVPKILDPQTSVRWRTILWLTFSVIFFSQLALGILGFSSFLMSGDLHFPIPALIIAGPVYRGENFFMPILFAGTLLFIGPAWCSYFCYLGGWDFLASQQLKRPQMPSRWRRPLQIVILVMVVVCALALRLLEAPTSLVIWLVSLYGVGAVFVMLFFSRRRGSMVHCTTWCPVGLVANIAGKISPFRLRIDDSCSGCRKCSLVCRYDALRAEHIQRKKPGLSCTLCGDCLSSCHNQDIHYSFPGLSAQAAQRLFVVMVVSFHAVSIGVARI